MVPGWTHYWYHFWNCYGAGMAPFLVVFWNILGAGSVSPIGPFPYIHVSDFCPYQNRIWHSAKTENGEPPKLQNWVQLCSRFRINWHPQIAQARVPKPPSGGYRNRKSGGTETARREVPGRPHGKFQSSQGEARPPYCVEAHISQRRIENCL